MPESKKAPAKSSRAKGAAARAEKKPEPKTVEFRGLKLKIPDKMPAVIGFDMFLVDDEVAGMFQALDGVIGREQLVAVRDKVAEDGDSMTDLVEILNDLMNDVGEAYGMAEGEASASQDS